MGFVVSPIALAVVVAPSAEIMRVHGQVFGGGGRAVPRGTHTIYLGLAFPYQSPGLRDDHFLRRFRRSVAESFTQDSRVSRAAKNITVPKDLENA